MLCPSTVQIMPHKNRILAKMNMCVNGTIMVYSLGVLISAFGFCLSFRIPSNCGLFAEILHPLAEMHFIPALERFTRIQSSEDSAHIRLTDEELFDYPFLLIQQPGQNPWDPTDEEVSKLREYLLRGGFLMATLVSSLPTWSHIDPLPILESSSMARNNRPKDAIDQLFD